MDIVNEDYFIQDIYIYMYIIMYLTMYTTEYRNIIFLESTYTIR